MNNLIVDKTTNRINKITFDKIVLKENIQDSYLLYNVEDLQTGTSTTLLQFFSNETLTETLKNYNYQKLE